MNTLHIVLGIILLIGAVLLVIDSLTPRVGWRIALGIVIAAAMIWAALILWDVAP